VTVKNSSEKYLCKLIAILKKVGTFSKKRFYTKLFALLKNFIAVTVTYKPNKKVKFIFNNFKTCIQWV
jgi:hypothetical protein